MRTLLAVLGALLLLVTTVGAAAGVAAVKESDHVQDVGCNAVATPDGIASFYATKTDVFGTDGYLDVWSGEGEDAELVWTRDFDRPVSVTFGPTSADVTIPLVPSGEAHIVAALEPAEDIAFTDSGKDGNSRYRLTVTGTGFEATGTLALPGSDPVPFGPMDCSASDVRVENFFTRPHASVRTFSSTNGSCELINDEGDTAVVFLGFIEESSELFFDTFVTNSGGEELSAAGVGSIVGGSASLTLDEYDPDTGEPTGEGGTADLSLTETGDDFSFVLRSSNTRVRVSGSLVDVEGSMTMSLGSFDLGPCVVAAVRSKEHTNATNGPKPGGKRPANDLPSGAKTLRVGGKASVSTKGAQVPSETGYPCMVIEDEAGPITVPVEYTVWYKIAGTGQSITVDTAGSSYDTVAAAYAGSPNESATVACVDDTPLVPFGRSLQASVTFPTVVGTTYWVQIGGYQEGVFGPDPNVPYGNLRVRVR